MREKNPDEQNAEKNLLTVRGEGGGGRGSLIEAAWFSDETAKGVSKI